MPWLEQSPMDQRMQVIVDYQRGLHGVSELAARYGVSRKTVYKWIDRHDADATAGLADRSRRPLSCSQATPPAVVEAVLAARRRHPRWGAKKLLKILRRAEPETAWPARSTICDLLRRHGLIVPARRRPRRRQSGGALAPMTAPNAIWTVDFKGQFKTGDGVYCYPLTLVDGYSRFLLACQGLRSTASSPAQAIFWRAFAEYGLPTIIRSDNGVPFATTALGRLSRLAVWWIRLGIYPERIAPAHPEQNGRHERLHRTLKAETTRPPARNLQAQQTRFNRFRLEYNADRPHEGLAQETPGSIYQPSPRPLPRTLPTVTYPAHYEVRRVASNSGIRWKGAWVAVTDTLAGEDIGFEEVDDGWWDVYFGPVRLGRLDERTRRIADAAPSITHDGGTDRLTADAV